MNEDSIVSYFNFDIVQTDFIDSAVTAISGWYFNNLFLLRSTYSTISSSNFGFATDLTKVRSGRKVSSLVLLFRHMEIGCEAGSIVNSIVIIFVMIVMIVIIIAIIVILL